jgi:hypothetical protein
MLNAIEIPATIYKYMNGKNSDNGVVLLEES